MGAGRVIAEGTPGRAQGPPRRRPGARRPAAGRRRGRRSRGRARRPPDRGPPTRSGRARRRGRVRRRHGRAARRRPRPRRRGDRRPTDVLLREPTLDEVFLHLTDRPSHHRHRRRSPMTATSTLRQSWIIMPARPQALAARAVDPAVRDRVHDHAACSSSATSSAASIALPGGGDYLSYLMPGMFALAMMFGLEATMTAIVERLQEGHHRPLPLAADQQRRRAARARRRRPGQLGGRAGGADGRRPARRLAVPTGRGRRPCSRSGCCCGCASRCCGSGSSSAWSCAARAA